VNKLIIGDSREVMREPPPYWGLRDYGVAGQLGLESTPQEYMQNMVEVFRLVRELLADDGTVWLNLGDCYATGAGKVGCCPGGGEQGARWRGDVDRVRDEKRGYRGNRNGHEGKHGYGDNGIGIGPMTQPNRMPIAGLKPKDLVGIPWRVAFALQADGWYLRQDIIWSKPNPMPESVRDRCTKAHEYIFLLSKRERYYYDADAIAEQSTTGDLRKPYGPGQVDKRGNGHDRGGGMLRAYTKPYNGTATKDFESSGAQNASEVKARIVGKILAGELTARNKRSVWTVTTQPYAEAHFATFPPALIEPCILAGSKPGDIVLDPFGGSGTTGEVAEHLGRQWLLIELNPAYSKLIQRRTEQMGMAI